MAGLHDCVRFGRGFACFAARDILASSEFQMMTLEERGRWFTDLMAECPALEAPDRYVPVAERETVAKRYGAAPGSIVPVSCPCGAAGEIHWTPARLRFVDMDLDHIRPVSKGGPNVASNLRLLCPSCNRSRGNREVA
jgi:hypothetical protein